MPRSPTRMLPSAFGCHHPRRKAVRYSVYEGDHSPSRQIKKDQSVSLGGVLAVSAAYDKWPHFNSQPVSFWCIEYVFDGRHNPAIKRQESAAHGNKRFSETEGEHVSVLIVHECSHPLAPWSWRVNARPYGAGPWVLTPFLRQVEEAA